MAALGRLLTFFKGFWDSASQRSVECSPVASFSVSSLSTWAGPLLLTHRGLYNFPSVLLIELTLLQMRQWAEGRDFRCSIWRALRLMFYICTLGFFCCIPGELAWTSSTPRFLCCASKDRKWISWLLIGWGEKEVMVWYEKNRHTIRGKYWCQVRLSRSLWIWLLSHAIYLLSALLWADHTRPCCSFQLQRSSDSWCVCVCVCVTVVIALCQIQHRCSYFVVAPLKVLLNQCKQAQCFKMMIIFCTFGFIPRLSFLWRSVRNPWFSFTS